MNPINKPASYSEQNLLDDLNAVAGGYYQVNVVRLQMKASYWHLRAHIFRTDSSELVGGHIVSTSQPDADIYLLLEPLTAKINELPQPPYEWLSPARGLLRDYRSFNDQLTSILVGLNRCLSKGELSEDELHKRFWEARELAIKGAIGLSHRLFKLEEQEQVDLMQSADAAYADPIDAYHLDDLDGRVALFELMDNPSAAVIQAQEMHRQRWTKAIDRIEASEEQAGPTA